jgi:predicted glutamine amidotransferase
MCRLAAFPPNFPRKKALEILLDMESYNQDGVGSVYVKDGQFVVDKYPKSITKILTKGVPFLSHMPYNGWTVAHLRAASHGKNSYENTHPFIVGDWAIVHNGIWSEHDTAKMVMQAMDSNIKFKGQTDTEVAANLINIMGPQKFAETIDGGGVFLSLNINGELQVSKTSGELRFYRQKNTKQVVIASEFPANLYHRYSADIKEGWFKFDNRGLYLNHKMVIRKRAWKTSQSFIPSSSFHYNKGTQSFTPFVPGKPFISTSPEHESKTFPASVMNKLPAPKPFDPNGNTPSFFTRAAMEDWEHDYYD